MGVAGFLARLRRDAAGSMALETAIITPVLAMMALGVFDVSMMVSREQHLQSAANEASEIILAAAGGSGIDSDDLDTLLETSLQLQDKITIAPLFRCGTSTTTSTTAPTCPTGHQMYSYVQVTVADSYTPMWTSFGVGNAINYSITRTVQVA